MTEDASTVGDPAQTEDGEDESTSLNDLGDEQWTGKVEALEAKVEVTVALPPRRASTSTPSNLPVRLLTRLGSLDGEFIDRTPVPGFTALPYFNVFLPRCPSSAN